MQPLSAPFPWFGGKRRVADIIWSAFGDVNNYVEPFFGSGAVLLARPSKPKIETVNDKDAMVSNFWRAIKSDPEQVAYHADWPANENDLHARHGWLVQQKKDLVERIEGDPAFFDAKIAGWWVWGICLWIGGKFCSGNGPWKQVDGRLVKAGNDIPGINRKIINLSSHGNGINRQLIHLGNYGQGVHKSCNVEHWFSELSSRLRNVRVCCGDWSRVCGSSVMFQNGTTGVFFDPPYGVDDRDDVYNEESREVAIDVRKYCAENGNNKLLRIALCGYSGEGHEDLERLGWTVHAWKAAGGYGSQGNRQGRENAGRERIWFSPHCLKPTVQLSLI